MGVADLVRERGPVLPVAALLLMAVGTRSFDAVPGIQYIRPALTIGVFGGIWVLLRMGSARVQQAMRRRTFVAIALLYGWAILAIPFSIYPGGIIRSLQPLLPIFMLTVAILASRPTTASVEYLQRALVVGCTLTGVGSLARGVYVEAGRLSGVGTLDPNDLAAVASIGTIAALGLMMRRTTRGGVKLLALLAVAVLLVVIVKTGSRGGVLAITSGALVLVALQPGTRRLALGALVVVAAASAWSFGPDSFRERIGSLVAGEKDYNDFDYYGRKELRARGVQYTIERPIFGVGWQMFPEYEGRNCMAQGRRGCRWMAPHNMYVQVSSELGIPGLILFLGVLVTSLRAAWQTARRSLARVSPADFRPELFATLVSYCVSGYFLSHAYLYVALALMALSELAATAARRRAQAVPIDPALDGVPAPTPRVRGRRGGLALPQPRAAAVRAFG